MLKCLIKELFILAGSGWGSGGGCSSIPGEQLEICWTSRIFLLCPSCENASSRLCPVQPGLTGFTPAGHVKDRLGHAPSVQGVWPSPCPLSPLAGIVYQRCSPFMALAPTWWVLSGGGGGPLLLASLGEPSRCSSIKGRMPSFQEAFTFKITKQIKWPTVSATR